MNNNYSRNEEIIKIPTRKCFREKKEINDRLSSYRQGLKEVLLVGRGFKALIKFQSLHKTRIQKQRYGF